jgi:exonuclease SbcC
MIKQLYLNNIRNIRGEVTEDLSGLDLFVGPNGSGKSTRLDAVPLVCQGFIPGRGEKPAEVFKDSNADAMGVGIITDRNDFRRYWEVKGDTVEQRITVNGAPMKVGDGNNRIAQSVGRDDVLFNLSEFLKLSDDKKKDFMFNMGAKVDKAEAYNLFLTNFFNAILMNDIGMALQMIYKVDSLSQLDSAQREAFIESLIGRIEIEEMRPIVKQTLYGITQMSTASAQDLLSQIVAKIAEDLNATRKAKRGYEATNKTLRELQDDKVIDATLAEIETEKQSLFAKQRDLDKRVNDNKHNKEKRERVINQTARLKSLLEALNQFNAETTQKEIDELSTKLTQAEQYQVAYADFSRIKNEADFKLNYLQEQRGRLDTVQGFCILSEQVVCSTDLTRAKANLDGLIHAAETDAVEAETNLNNFVESVVEYYPFDKVTSDLRRQIQEKQTQITQADKEREIYTKELADLQTVNLDEFVLVDDVVLTVEQNDLTTHIKANDQHYRDQISIKENMATIRAAALAAKEAEMRIEVDKVVINAAKSTIDNLLSTTIEPINKLVNELLTSIGETYRFKMALDDNGKFRYGRVNHNNFTAFDTLSGGETVIFSIALLTAIVIHKDPPLKVLCIKAAEVSEEYILPMLNGLKAMKPHLDNILVEYPHTHLLENKSDAFEGWTIHRMGV